MEKIKILTVTDLHQNEDLYESLAKAVKEHQPDVLAFVGDFLDAGRGKKSFSIDDVIRAIGQMKVKKVIFIRGNHEDENWWYFFHVWTPLFGAPIALHAEGYKTDPGVLIGFPCLMGDEEAFRGDREMVMADTETWLPSVFQQFGKSARSLWLMHEPSTGTSLSTPNSVVQGNVEWREAIEKYQPWLVIFGHDHRTPKKNQWHDTIGETLCVNVGQYTPKKVHYTLVEMTFSENQPLPEKMKVAVFPQKKSLERELGNGIWKTSKN